jgi:hypothetical protein
MNRFLFVGLNYNHIKNRHIETITNVHKLTEYIKKTYNILINEDHIIIDDKDKYKTSRQGIILQLYKLALESWNKQVDNIFIYYTGDSINIVEYVYAYNNGYKIKQGIVPSDYNESSIISKEELKSIFEQFNPRTRIIFISDCCYTNENILGLKYTWSADSDIFSVEKDRELEISNRKVITISYVLQDSKTDEDNFFNVLSINEKINSLADYITKLDNKNETIFSSLKDIHNILQMKKVNMKPTLSASYNILNENTNIFNYLNNAQNIRSSFEEYKKKSYTVINNNNELANITKNTFRPISTGVIEMENIINEPKETNQSYDYTRFTPCSQPNKAYIPITLPVQNKIIYQNKDEPSLSHSYTSYMMQQKPYVSRFSTLSNRSDLSKSFAYTRYECYC